MHQLAVVQAFLLHCASLVVLGLSEGRKCALEVTDVSGIVKYIGKSVFRDQNVGEAPPPPNEILVWGEVGGCTLLPMNIKTVSSLLFFLLSHCRLKTHVRGKQQSRDE